MRWPNIVLALVMAISIHGISPLTTTQTAGAADACSEFIADITVPDGMMVAPGQTIEKVWRLRNCGTTDWEGYRAVKTNGTFGPDEADVPITPPGGTLDLTITMTAPTTIGEHWASYRLQGPTRSLGGVIVLVDVADCTSGEAPGLSAASEDLRAIMLRHADLGAEWCAVHGDSTSRWSLAQYTLPQHESARRALLWASLWPDEDWAAQALEGLPKGWIATETGVNFEAVSDRWDIGDDTGWRGAWKRNGSTLGGIMYVFRVGRAVGWVEVSGNIDDADFDQQALNLADRQITRMREHDTTYTSVPRPTPEALFEALLDAPFTRSTLSDGLSPSRVREVGGPAIDQAPPPGPLGLAVSRRPQAPVGVAELLITNRHDTASRPAEIVISVFQNDEDALDTFQELRPAAFLYVPGMIGQPTICGSGECGVLYGNVLIRAVGAPNAIELPGYGTRDPSGFNTVSLARAGAAHLDVLFDALTR